MTKRKGIGKKLRFDVFKRDAFTCQYCGATPPGEILEVDHITPVSKGGDNDKDNLITSCRPCNSGKGAGELSDIPQPLSERAEEVSEREAQVKGYNKIMMAARRRKEREAKQVGNLFLRQFDYPDNYALKDDWMTSVKKFIEKMGVAEVLDSMEYAICRKPNSEYACWKYFCGTCWGKIRDRGLA